MPPDFFAQCSEGGAQAGMRSAPRPGEALAQDLVPQMTAGYSFVANRKVIETEKKMMGALLNEQRLKQAPARLTCSCPCRAVSPW